MTANEQILSRQIAHQIFLQRYSTQTVRKIERLLSRLDSRLVDRLNAGDISSFSRARLERLLEDIRNLNADIYRQITQEIRADLRGLATYEADFQVRLLTAEIPAELDFVTPSATQLWSAATSRPFEGRLLREWLRDVSENSARRVRGAVQMGVAEGRTTDQIVRDIRGTRAAGFRDGVLARPKRATEAMVRTAVNHTASAARAELYRQNESLIKGVRWVSTLDGRTSAICRSLDGEVFPVNSGPRPPAHVGCRSTTTPVIKSWRSLGLKGLPEATRASMSGQVPDSETYQTWLSKQPASFQDDVLGVTKGKLFRNGDLSLGKFVDRNGAELTLDQLRAAEADAFEAAGL